MPISDTMVRNAKSREQPYKLSDSKGMYLQVESSGSKLWRLKYRFNGKERRLVRFTVKSEYRLQRSIQRGGGWALLRRPAVESSQVSRRNSLQLGRFEGLNRKAAEMRTCGR
jgi:hypothetical protein